MKLHLPQLLRAAVVAACFGAPAVATDMYTLPTFADGNGVTGPTYTWADGHWTNAAGTAANPARSTDKGPVLVLDNVGTLNNTVSIPDTSDYGGIKVTGDSTVSCSLGGWAGSIIVGEGASLSTSYNQQLKNTEGQTAANVYVDGTLTFVGRSDLNLADGKNYQNWYIGKNGLINLSGVSSVTKGGRVWNMQINLAENADPTYEGKVLTNRTLSENASIEKTFLTSSGDLFQQLDSLTVFRNGVELDADSYTINHTGSGMSVIYTAKGIERATLTWAGGEGTWEDIGTHWTDGADVATSFISGDSAVFTGSDNVANVSGTVSAKDVTVAENAGLTLNAASGNSLSVGNLIVGSGATVTTADATGLNIEKITLDADATVAVQAGASLSSDAFVSNGGSLQLGAGASFTLATMQNNFSGKVTGADGALHLNLSSNNLAGGDSTIVLADGSDVGHVYLDSGVFSTNINGSAKSSDLKDATLHMANTRFVVRNGVGTGDVTAVKEVRLSGSNILQVYGSVQAGTTMSTNFLTEEGATANVERNDGGNIVLSGAMNLNKFLNSAGNTGLAGNVTLNELQVNGGTLNMSGTANVATSLYVHGGTANISGNLTTPVIYVRDGHLVLNGGTTTATRLRMSENGDNGGALTVNSGAVLNITGSNNDHSTGATLLLAHWAQNSTLNVAGGTLNAADAEVKMSWDGTGTLNVTAGVLNAKGINFRDHDFWGNGSAAGTLNLGDADNGSGSGRINLGASGISYAQGSSVINLGNGTLGATADWSMGANGTATAVTVNLKGNTLFDTTDAADGTTARTITVNNNLEGSNSGKLYAQGKGTLELNGTLSGVKTLGISGTEAVTLKVGAGEHAVDVLDASSNGSSVGSIVLKDGADMTVSGSLWMHTGASILLEEGARVKRDAITIQGTGSTASLTTTAANAQYGTGNSTFTISNAAVQLSGDATTVANKLENTQVSTADGSSVKFTNAANTLQTLQAGTGATVGLMNITESTMVENVIIGAGATLGVYVGTTVQEAEVAAIKVNNLTVSGTGTMNADLIVNGGTLTFADGAVLTMGCNVTLGTIGPVTVALTQNMVDTIADGGRVTLFTSVEGADLGDFIQFGGAEGVTLAQPGVYKLAYDEAAKTIYVAPEPATATLSLLALAALASRRRRK